MALFKNIITKSNLINLADNIVGDNGCFDLTKGSWPNL